MLNPIEIKSKCSTVNKKGGPDTSQNSHIKIKSETSDCLWNHVKGNIHCICGRGNLNSIQNNEEVLNEKNVYCFIAAACL